MTHDTTNPIRIAAWTLCGPGRVEEAHGAWASAFAARIDEHIIVDTAPEDTPPLMIVDPFGLATRAVRWPWRDDFAAARNAALAFASETGADWSCMLDTDERIICHDHAALRAYLAALPPSITVASAHDEHGTATRERFFRLPCAHKFVGTTHEMLDAPPEVKVLLPRDLVRWSELPKTPAQLWAKHTRDVAMLRADIAKDPTNGAAWFYLGESLHFLAHPEGAPVDMGMIDEAIAAYEQHNRLSRFEEARAWVSFKCGVAYLTKGMPHGAIECAAKGLTYFPAMAELYWIAAVACINHGWVEQAEAWALSGMPHVQGTPSEVARAGFRNLRGVTTGLPEVLEAVRAKREAGL